MSLLDTPVHQRYANGDVIVSEGILSNNAYVVLAGEVRITKKLDKRTVVIGTLKSGEVFGEMGLITESVRSANVVAIGDVTIGLIDKERFNRILGDEIPEDIRAILSALVERLRLTTNLLTKIGLELEDTRKRVQSYTLKEQ